MAVGIAAGVFAQGQITFDNGGATNFFVGATNAGAVFVKTGSTTALVNQDINVALLGGASAGSLSQLAVLQLQGNGLGQGDVTGIGTPGVFTDLSGALITIPGTGANGNAFFQVEAWTGNALTYAAAQADGTSAWGITPVFVNPTGGTAPVAPADLTGMPSLVLTTPTVTPEPTTLALCGLGAASLLLFRRKKS